MCTNPQQGVQTDLWQALDLHGSTAGIASRQIFSKKWIHTDAQQGLDLRGSTSPLQGLDLYRCIVGGRIFTVAHQAVDLHGCSVSAWIYSSRRI